MFTPDEIDYILDHELEREHPPPESEIRAWCLQNKCSVDMTRFNLYKQFQQAKFHRNMETNERDRDKYNRYMSVRAAYYYRRNLASFKKLSQWADEARIDHFNLLWRATRVHRAKAERYVDVPDDDISLIDIDIEVPSVDSLDNTVENDESSSVVVDSEVQQDTPLGASEKFDYFPSTDSLNSYSQTMQFAPEATSTQVSN